MKHLFSRTAILLLASFVTLVSCSKTNTAPATSAITDPRSVIVNGTWVVDTYAQRTENKTSSFSGYVFTFTSGGAIKADFSGESTTGSWAYTPTAVTYYGSSNSSSSFTINLGNASPLNRLNLRWNIDSVNTTSSKLALVSPEVAEGLRLNFVKK